MFHNYNESNLKDYKARVDALLNHIDKLETFIESKNFKIKDKYGKKYTS